MDFIFPPTDFWVKESLPPLLIYWIILGFAGWLTWWEFWFLVRFVILLCKFCSQDFHPGQLCLPLHQLQPALAAGTYSFPLVQAVLGINTPKYFQRAEHRTVCISASFLWYIIWKYADCLNLVSRSGSYTQYVFHGFCHTQCSGRSMHTHLGLWAPPCSLEILSEGSLGTSSLNSLKSWSTSK